MTFIKHTLIIDHILFVIIGSIKVTFFDICYKVLSIISS